MTRAQLLDLLIKQARVHGFAFRKWFERSTGQPWESQEAASSWLARGERANILIFSHTFAQHFWRSGERMSFVVPPQTFERVTTGGATRTVQRRAHVRRSSHADVWQYHLREMAVATEPLRYIRRYLITEETLADTAIAPPPDHDMNYDDEITVRDAD